MTRRQLLLAVACSGMAAAFTVPPPRLLRHRRNVIKEPAVLLKSSSQATPPQYSLYKSRWTHLGMLSFLALVSDWVCFATAAVPREFAAATGHDPAALIDIFLAFNVGSCFLYTDVSRRLGLRKSTVLAAGLMAFGCLLRCGNPTAEGLPSYSTLVVGTALVGLAQPFFQCAPPLLSATWFSSTERSLATATALNANQLGIAAAFVVGGAAVPGRDGEAIKHYLELIAGASLLAFGLAAAFFSDRPPTPPTASAAAKLALPAKEEDDGEVFAYPSALTELSQVPGFFAALIAFVASICVTNLVSAFAGDALERAGCGEAGRVALVGAGFQIAIVLGGVVIGSFVDKTRAYKPVTLACLAAAISMITLLGVAEGYDAQMPAGLVVAAILALGAVAGPIQPINAELAVEVAHPFDENAVEATQQLAGNLASAVLVPAYQFARKFDVEVEPADRHSHHYGFISDLHENAGLVLPEPSLVFGNRLIDLDVRGDSLLLFGLLLGTFLIFQRATFSLNRASLDDAATDAVSERQKLP